MKPCEYCSVKFSPKVTYQIYCSENCRTSATKEKITERYNIARRQKRKNKKRICLGGCDTKLSIYNDSGFCSNCNVHQKAVEKMIKKLKGFIDYEQDI